MPLVRTPRGLQWLEPSDVATEEIKPLLQTPDVLPALPKKLPFGLTSKDLLTWVLAAFHLVSWFGVRYLTSDRLQQQQQDDHVAIADIRAQLNTLDKGQSALGAKVDLLLTLQHNRTNN